MTHRSLSPLLCGLAMASSILVHSDTAQADMFRGWVTAHGTTGYGEPGYLNDINEPRLGYGGEIGAQVLFIEAFMELNHFGTGEVSYTQTTENNWFNLLGGGFRFGLPFGSEKFKPAVRLNGAFVNNSYADEGYHVRSFGGLARAGMALDYEFNPFLAFTSTFWGGYNLTSTQVGGCALPQESVICSSESGLNDGMWGMLNVGLRFQLGI